MFIDANIFTYLLTGHPIYGRNCQQLLEKVESGDLEAFISPLAEITIPLAYHPQRKFLAARFPARPSLHQRLRQYREPLAERPAIWSKSCGLTKRMKWIRQ